jgi:tripartite ATP-independent transporter DctM subunit
MSDIQVAVVLGAVTFLVLFSGVPIAFGLTAVAVGFLVVFQGLASLNQLAITFMGELSSFALLTIPLFVLLGAAVGVSRAGADIYESLHRWLARVPGGLVIANILACGLFAAICGSSPATAAAIGKIGVPEMLRRGYPPSLATGAICAGGTLGILIPPSLTMILYGIATETSIGRLFIAGVLPGLMLVAMFAIYAWLVSLWNQRGRPMELDTYTLRQKAEGLGRVTPFLLIIVVITVAMYGGYATPSEIAALAAFLALALVMVIYRTWRPGELWLIFRDTIRESSMIMMIMGAAAIFSYMMSLLYVTQTLADLLVNIEMNRWLLMILINAFLLAAGCFLPPAAIILMTMPILQPVLEAHDFDIIWFAVIMTINMEIGLIHPPVGLNLYVLRGVAPQVPLTKVMLGSLPFILLMFLGMVILAIFPEIATWLPQKMMGARI